MKARAVACFVLCLCWALSPAVFAQPNSPDGLTYKTGYSSMMKLGRDIYKKLKVYAGAEHPHVAQQPQPLKFTERKPLAK